MSIRFGPTGNDESFAAEGHRSTLEAPAWLQEKGLTISGTSPDGRLVEAVELTDRDFYIGVQYHPEFKSRPNKPHPLFKGFIDAALKRQAEKSLSAER